MRPGARFAPGDRFSVQFDDGDNAADDVDRHQFSSGTYPFERELHFAKLGLALAHQAQAESLDGAEAQIWCQQDPRSVDEQEIRMGTFDQQAVGVEEQNFVDALSPS